MATFGKKSLERLETLDPLLQAIVRQAILVMDFSILVGYRGAAEQNQAFNTGASQLKFPESKHNHSPAEAVDLAPYPIDWEDTESFVLLAGVIKAIATQMGVAIRWGGDWDGDDRTRDERFRDYGHFELKEERWLRK